MLRVLREVIRIAARSAVAHADVEISVGTEGDLAALVIAAARRLRDEALARRKLQVECGRRIEHERIAARSLVAADHRIATALFRGEVDVDAPAGRVIGRERQSEQAAFIILEPDRAGRAADIEEVVRQHRAIAHDADHAFLFDDVLHGGIDGILDHADRLVEAGGVGNERQLGKRRSGAGQHHRGDQQCAGEKRRDE